MSERIRLRDTLINIGIQIGSPNYDIFMAVFDTMYPTAEKEPGPAIEGHEIAVIKSIDPSGPRC